MAQTDVAGSNGYGTFTIDAARAPGRYTANTAHDEFVAGRPTPTPSRWPVPTAPTRTMMVNILGTNDAAVVTPGCRNLTETNARADHERHADDQ